MIREPGIYDIPISEYVADPCEFPSLSASIASVLLDRSPAHAFVRHPRLTKQPAAEEWNAKTNFGSAVHSLVFGGPKVQPYGYENWRKKEAQEDRADALKAGLIPLLLEEYERARVIAKSARAFLKPFEAGGVECEQTLVWQEREAWCRVRPDLMTSDMRTMVDLKVTGTNAREANKQFFSQGYDVQAAFMERGADALDAKGQGRRQIIYLFVEDEPPHAFMPLLVSEGTLTLARKKYRAAVNAWRVCLETQTWPAYPATLVPTETPAWAESAWLNRELAGSVNVEEFA